MLPTTASQLLSSPTSSSSSSLFQSPNYLLLLLLRPLSLAIDAKKCSGGNGSSAEQNGERIKVVEEVAK
jgi:hypothetical protein